MSTLLLITVLIPLAGSVLLFSRQDLPAATARMIALGVALGTLALSLVFVFAFGVDTAGPQFAYKAEDGHLGYPWLVRPDVRFALGLDGVALSLFALTSLLMITAIFSSWESIKERAAVHYALLLALETGLLGLFASLDVVLFYVFFEFTLIPLFFLIGLYGGPDRRRASVTFFLYTLAGSLLTLLGVIALVAINYQYNPSHTLTFSIAELTEGLAHVEWGAWNLSSSWTTSPQALIFLLLFAGFAIKVPLFPFHTWLPLAHVEAPTAGSILLAGVMLKVGGYGFLRFNLGMTPLGLHLLFPMLAVLSVAGILYGALAALAQSDIKRLVAYSSVSHMGFIALGLFSATPTGIEGAVIQMINHGLTTGALFACVGIVYERYHTREMSQIGGLWNRMPVFAFFLIMASLGSAALPGLNGFTGEFPILIGMYSAWPAAAVWAALGMVLGAYYLLSMLQRVLFGPLKEPGGHDHGHAPAGEHGVDTHEAPRPLGWHEIAGLTPLIVLIVWIGIAPNMIFSRIRPSVQLVEARLLATAPAKAVAAIAPTQATTPKTALAQDTAR
ncbi:NADH-quinone oxidoreductase subunit M [Isosphaeraceae bacterium EP7]